jgi:ELWxxDGT repeat protein
VTDVHRFPPGPRSRFELIGSGGRLCVIVNDGAWTSDGTLAGTVPVPGSAGTAPRELLDHNGAAYVTADVGGGYQVCVIDAGGLRTAARPNPNGDSKPSRLTSFGARPRVRGSRRHGRSGGAAPRNAAALGMTTCFAADGNAAADEPHVTDGTAAGTGLLANVNGPRPQTQNSLPGAFVSFFGRTFFRAGDGRSPSPATAC